MSEPTINKISNEIKRKLILKSVKGMANNPSEKGASPQQVKNAMTDPYIGDNESLLTEINRIVDEINDKISYIKNALNESITSIGETESSHYNELSGLIDDLQGDVDALESAVETINTSLAGKQTIANLYDGLDSNDATKYLSAKQGKVLKDLVDGKKKAVNYNNIEAMITALNSASNTDLNVGDDIYILTTEVPDFWVVEVANSSSTYTFTTLNDFLNTINTNNYVQVGYYKISKLETEKVDLSDYQPKGAFNIDNETTIVSHTYELNKEKTYSASGISSISINIPSTIGIGFYSGANFKVGSSVPLFAIVNNSSMPLKIINLGIIVDEYTPHANTTITTLVYNDGLNTYLQISEV